MISKKMTEYMPDKEPAQRVFTPPVSEGDA